VAITTLSSRAFNQDTGRAKKAARKGPVFITDRGRPPHVLLTIEDFQKLAGFQASNSHFVFLSMAGLCGIFGGTMGGVRAGQRSRRYWWRLREGESEQQVVP
jgi:hypothetical protein